MDTKTSQPDAKTPAKVYILKNKNENYFRVQLQQELSWFRPELSPGLSREFLDPFQSDREPPASVRSQRYDQSKKRYFKNNF